MRTLQINYDLVGPVRDYRRLFEYLLSFRRRSKPLKSLWFVRTTKTVAQVRKELENFVDSDDRVLVIDVTAQPWAANYNDRHSKWLLRQTLVAAARRAA